MPTHTDRSDARCWIGFLNVGTRVGKGSATVSPTGIVANGNPRLRPVGETDVAEHPSVSSSSVAGMTLKTQNSRDECDGCDEN